MRISVAGPRGSPSIGAPAGMPVDDREKAAGLERRGDGARQGDLVGHAVKGIADEHDIERRVDQPVDGAGVALDPDAGSAPGRLDAGARRGQHVRIEIEAKEPATGADDAAQGLREVAVAAAQVQRRHPRGRAEVAEDRLGIRPQLLPPVPVGHARGRKERLFAHRPRLRRRGRRHNPAPACNDCRAIVYCRGLRERHRHDPQRHHPE